MSTAAMSKAADEAHDSHPFDTIGDGKERSGKGSKGGSKSKDLSHVPCRFFKAGACTAGASCPFSHSAAEPGAPKGICQWYVKGNCKFGHKCALAHVLPGQPLSMDRKNKRAEQQAAKSGGSGQPNGNASKDRERGDARRANGPDHSDSSSMRSMNTSGAAPPANGTGTSTPLRPSSLSISSRPPMLIGKAAATVSTVASENALPDANLPHAGTRPSGIKTSFAAVASGASPGQSALSALRPNSSVAGLGSSPSALATGLSSNGRDSPLTPSSANVASSGSSPAPKTETDPEPTAPLPEARPMHRPNLSSDLGFGPIGSPPNASRLGTSPLRSPPSLAVSRAILVKAVPSPPPPAQTALDPEATAVAGVGSPPVSSSVQSNSVFMPYGPGGSVPSRMAPLSRLNSDTSRPVPNASARPRPSAWAGSLPASAFLNEAMGDSSAVETEEDEIDFLPSSLNELLTPGERSRRMSKSNLTRSKFDPDAGNDIPQRGHVHAPQPRFVSSVPTASLLNNIRGLWEEPSNEQPSRLGGGGAAGGESWSRGGGAGNMTGGLAGSYSAGVGVPSPSMLGTSNASAAFLPGHMHRNPNNNNGFAPRDPATTNGFSASFDPRRTLAHPPNPDPSRFYDGMGLPSSQTSDANGFPPNMAMNEHSYYGLHDASSNARQQQQQNPNVMRAPNQNQNQYMAMSPTSARALRAHEPGQSLPQGLAAGLSRIHLTAASAHPISPPAMSGGSPSAAGLSSSVLSSMNGFAAQQSGYGSWLQATSGEMSPPPGAGLGQQQMGVASPPRYPPPGFGPNMNGAAPYSSGLSRGAPPPQPVAGVRREASWAQNSPLARPTVPDDDAMFDFDMDP